jgi:hypothetical protein
MTTRLALTNARSMTRRSAASLRTSAAVSFDTSRDERATNTVTSAVSGHDFGTTSVYPATIVEGGRKPEQLQREIDQEPEQDQPETDEQGDEKAEAVAPMIAAEPPQLGKSLADSWAGGAESTVEEKPLRDGEVRQWE